MDFRSRLWRVLKGFSADLDGADPDALLDDLNDPDSFDRKVREAEARLAREAAAREARAGAGQARRERPQAGRSAKPASGPDELQRAYARLEVSPEASIDEVKAAWRKLMRKYHPDRHKEPAKQEVATRLAAALTEAYETIRRSRS